MNTEERILKVEEAVEQIGSQVGQIFTTLTGVEAKLNEVLKQLNDHQAVLYGERGTPGLLAWKEKAAEVLDELNLALKGYGDKPGLVSVISNLVTKIEAWDDDRKWLVRLVVGYIVTVLLGLVVIATK